MCTLQYISAETQRYGMSGEPRQETQIAYNIKRQLAARQQRQSATSSAKDTGADEDDEEAAMWALPADLFRAAEAQQAIIEKSFAFAQVCASLCVITQSQSLITVYRNQ